MVDRFVIVYWCDLNCEEQIQDSKVFRLRMTDPHIHIDIDILIYIYNYNIIIIINYYLIVIVILRNLYLKNNKSAA